MKTTKYNDITAQNIYIILWHSVNEPDLIFCITGRKIKVRIRIRIRI